jgi:hypothetical protein
VIATATAIGASSSTTPQATTFIPAVMCTHNAATGAYQVSDTGQSSDAGRNGDSFADQECNRVRTVNAPVATTCANIQGHCCVDLFKGTVVSTSCSPVGRALGSVAKSGKKSRVCAVTM